jgi:hypothetical protein
MLHLFMVESSSRLKNGWEKRLATQPRSGRLEAETERVWLARLKDDYFIDGLRPGVKPQLALRAPVAAE